jgi:YggT family protein
MLAQATNADIYNPLMQFIIRSTNPLLIPLRKIIPSDARFDVASLVLALMLIIAKVVLLKLVHDGIFPSEIFLMPNFYLKILTKILSMIINLLIYMTVALSLISWIQPSPYNPAVKLLNQILDPLLNPIRRFLPATGLDFSPIILILSLYVIDEISRGYLSILNEAIT